MGVRYYARGAGKETLQTWSSDSARRAAIRLALQDPGRVLEPGEVASLWRSLHRAGWRVHKVEGVVDVPLPEDHG